MPWQPRHGRMLFTRPTVSPQRLLLRRVYMVFALCLLAFTILYIDRDGLRDASKPPNEPMNLVDVVYFTMVTVATVGYGDIVPVTARARLVDALLIMPIRVIIWFIFLGTAYQLVIQRIVEEYRMKRLQRNLRGHILVCGYGLAGSIAVRELLESGTDARRIIVIDTSEAALEAATSVGVTGLLGDPSREDILREAQVARAHAVIVAVTDDPTAILVTLSVRSFAPKVKIVVRVQEHVFQRQLRQAGADVIVSSTKIGGLLLADAVETRYVVPFVSDMLQARGRVTLLERVALPGEIGQMTNEVKGAIVVGLARDGKVMEFYEDPHVAIEAGDTLVMIRSSRGEGKPAA
ncbi:TrkA-like protein [Caballeronia arationis]|jgi:voltage-gated potassium channel|uniref:Trk K+ transport system, NAD-binding component n=1 Tax=Caballeronia arationis TaxID=1777142 RepID=A0A7Z7I5R6_9BURK|nr:potassium channel family protein [Caballeronia arationis]SAK53146.1 TrkA-like protein [Caballeronia arationis]SOE65684.1 Trk K+ transport system, NAD-binding component [Caballeronia arationis]